MGKPLLIMIGADKGGVGKTTVARAMDDYLQTKRASRRVFDSEYPSGDLSRFVTSSIIINIEDLDDQMRVFDSMGGVTMVDIKAGLFSQVLTDMSEVSLLDAVRAGRLNLALFHVLGPSASSLQEIAHVAETLGRGVSHVLVKNYVNESGYKEWETDTRFASTLRSARSIEIPHLRGRACTEVQKLGTSFSAFGENKDSSLVLSGYVRTWLGQVYAAFDGAGIKELIDEAGGVA